MPPTVLIPLAEQSGQIIDIGRWVLEQAWSDRRRWQRDRADDLAVSVNVSAHQLMSAGFAETVEAVLDSAPTKPKLLTLEVTESVFVSDGERALFVLNDLKDIGVKLALDDFGTGYSSLGYLRRFPVDTVKVDREFVANLGHDPASHTIITAVIGLAHGPGMTVVSEGVETAEQHHQLTALGCDSCQAYYFAGPRRVSTRFCNARLLKANGASRPRRRRQLTGPAAARCRLRSLDPSCGLRGLARAFFGKAPRPPARGDLRPSHLTAVPQTPSLLTPARGLPLGLR